MAVPVVQSVRMPPGHGGGRGFDPRQESKKSFCYMDVFIQNALGVPLFNAGQMHYLTRLLMSPMRVIDNKSICILEPSVYELFISGDRKAFETYFEKYYPALVLFSYKYTNDEGAAQDIASDSLLKAFNQRHTLNGFEHLKRFLYLATRNASINFLRHENFIIKEEEKFLSNTFCEVEDLNNQLDVALCENINLALGKLPPKTQRIIKSLYIDCLTYNQVAEKYGTTKKNVENIRHYGLGKMKLLLQDLYSQSLQSGEL